MKTLKYVEDCGRSSLNLLSCDLHIFAFLFACPNSLKVFSIYHAKIVGDGMSLLKQSVQTVEDGVVYMVKAYSAVKRKNIDCLSY